LRPDSCARSGLLFADYQSEVDCRRQVDVAYRDVEHWTKMAILITARSGKFSSGSAIRDYASQIWKVKSVPIQLLSQAGVRAGLMQ
jgi:starch phosphorylase